MKNLFLEFMSNETYTKFEIDDILNILDTYGFDNGERLKKMFSSMLYRKTFKNDLTFLEFAKLTGKNLVVCVANLTNECSEFWCVDKTPLYSVISALHASCALPIIFSPVVINNVTYIDGGIYNNFPISYIDKQKYNEVIGINVTASKYQYMNNFAQYLRFIAYTTIERSGWCIPDDMDLCKHIINLSFESEGGVTFENLSIKVNPDSISELISYGYNAAKQHFSTKEETVQTK
jgi:predicted acylesterase/phospholipase RssA